MSYISGHYRKGHFRNGKWVSGGYVKSHYRSGLYSGSGLYSTNKPNTVINENDICDDKAKGEIYNSQDAFLNERREYWRKVREEEGRAPGIEVKNKKVKDFNTLSTGQILSIIIVCCFFGVLLASPLGNYVFAIIIIIALMKVGILK